MHVFSEKDIDTFSPILTTVLCVVKNPSRAKVKFEIFFRTFSKETLIHVSTFMCSSCCQRFFSSIFLVCH